MNRRTLYIPDVLWRRLLLRVARDQGLTGERLTVSRWVRELLESELRVADDLDSGAVVVRDERDV